MGIAELVAPAVCGGCGRTGVSPCDACVGAMRPGGFVAGVDLRVVSAVRYEGVVRDLVAGVKFRGRRSALRWMADATAAAVAWADVEADLVTWVPASKEGRRGRGFDQGRPLALAVGRRLDRPVVRLLRRSAAGHQVGLDRAGRSVTATRIVASGGAAERVRGATVLVVDDVVTTGASMAAAARALLACGAVDVRGAAFAHTP